MLPITLSNAIGGAVFVGAYKWWVYLHCEDGERDGGGGLSLDGHMGANRGGNNNMAYILRW